MRILKWLGGLVVVLVLISVVLAVAARFHDGPIEVFPGGPLEHGDLVREPVTDWSFVADVDTVEMQLIADGNLSRTTWIIPHEGSAYLPVTLGFPPGKSWQYLASKEGAAMLRIDGKRYPVTLAKVDDPGMLEELGTANRAKYPPAPGSDAGSWYFELRYRLP